MQRERGPFAWKSPVVTDAHEAQRLIALEDESVFSASADVVRFYAELIKRFPPPASFAEAQHDEGGALWADGPEGSDRVIYMSIRSNADDKDLDAIVELARKYDSVLYDPQVTVLPLPCR